MNHPLITIFLMTGNHNNNKNHYDNGSGDKQSNSQALIPLERLFHTKKPVTNNAMVRPLIITPSAIWAISSIGDLGHRFDLRFLRRLSIRKSSSFLPPLIAATSQRGLTPRPAQVSPDGPRYFGGTFLPFNALPPPPTTLAPPTTAIALSILSICFCSGQVPCDGSYAARSQSPNRSNRRAEGSIIVLRATAMRLNNYCE